MECKEIKELLSNYLENDLSIQQKEEIERHLSVCKDCKAQLDSLKRLVSELGGLKKVAAPADMLEGINRRLGIEPKKKVFLNRLKIPLEAAGVLVSVILIVLFINQTGILRPGKQTGMEMAKTQVLESLEVAQKEILEVPATADYKVSEGLESAQQFDTSYEKGYMGEAGFASKGAALSRMAQVADIQEAPMQEIAITESMAQNLVKVKGFVRELEGTIEKEEPAKLYIRIPAGKLSNLFVWLKGLSGVMSTDPEVKEGSAYLAIEFYEGP